MLGIGALKGLVVGGALGAAFHFGLKWTLAPGLLGYLIAMGAGATAGLFTGQPFWDHDAWIESLLKALAGMALGALTLFGLSFLSTPLPVQALGLAEPAPIFHLPLFFAPLITLLFGALVELDNRPDDEASKPPSKQTS